jgi:hypothetical protein
MHALSFERLLGEIFQTLQHVPTVSASETPDKAAGNRFAFICITSLM